MPGDPFETSRGRGVRINGTLRPVRSSVDISYDPTRGRITAEEWTSAGANLFGMAAECERNRIAYTLKSNPVKSTISITSTAALGGITSLVVDTWQLVSNELQNDIKQHEEFRALTTIEKAAIFNALSDIQAGDATVTVEAFTAAFGAIPGAFLGHLVSGTTHYAVNQYVLRHTTNVSNVYEGLDTDDGSGQIYTNDQLFLEIQSAGWTFPCPSRITRKITGITTGQVAHTGYQWGWLKKGCTETTSANNRVDISSEYWLAEWSMLLYPLKP